MTYIQHTLPLPHFSCTRTLCMLAEVDCLSFQAGTGHKNTNEKLALHLEQGRAFKTLAVRRNYSTAVVHYRL